jgi:hypothetical protein
MVCTAKVFCYTHQRWEDIDVTAMVLAPKVAEPAASETKAQ